MLLLKLRSIRKISSGVFCSEQSLRLMQDNPTKLKEKERSELLKEKFKKEKKKQVKYFFYFSFYFGFSKK